MGDPALATTFEIAYPVDTFAVIVDLLEERRRVFGLCLALTGVSTRKSNESELPDERDGVHMAKNAFLRSGVPFDDFFTGFPTDALSLSILLPPIDVPDDRRELLT